MHISIFVTMRREASQSGTEMCASIVEMDANFEIKLGINKTKKFKYLRRHGKM